MRRILILSFVCLLVTSSCAHRSGRSRTRESSSRRHTTATSSRSKSRQQERSSRGRTTSNRSQKSSNAAPKSFPSNSEQGQKLTAKQIYNRYNKAVFMIYTDIAQGTGFYINSSGLAVSNYHVFEGARNVMVKYPNTNIYFEVTHILYESEEDDVVLFQVDRTNTTWIPIARTRPSIGEQVYAIGCPRGLENTISDGIVSQYREDDMLQITVPVDHGSSGGPLINESGEVVGITTAILEGSQANLNFAKSIELVRPYIPRQ